MTCHQTHLRCSSCFELLHQPTTLPCGLSVCSACVKLPTVSSDLKAIEDELATTFDSATVPPSVSNAIRFYRCPAKLCRKRHFGKPVADFVLANLIQLLFPKEMRVLDGSLVEEVSEFRLQLPYLAESKKLVAAGDFLNAIKHADIAHSINPWNRRGIIARRIAELRWREAGLEVVEMDDPSGDSGGGLNDHVETPAPISINAIPLIPNVPPEELGIDCPLCLNPLCDPITLKCGHSACRVCLLDSFQSSTLCAICRTPLPSFETLLVHPRNLILDTLISSWLNGTDARTSLVQEREDCLNRHRLSTELTIPIFICTLAFIGTKQQFHIFEPRYRVMMKECIDNGTFFGVCIPKRSFNPFDEKYGIYGTACKIEFSETLDDPVDTSIGPLPRYFVLSKGQYRFKVTEPDCNISPEGLHYAKVVRVDDADPDQNSDSQYDALAYASNILKVRKNVKSMLERIDPARLRVLIDAYGRMPEDPSLLSLWACQWIPVTMVKKYEIMSDLDPTARLKFIADRI
ncbi:PUA-like domain-containing protein [Obelidium mucronatum]|nr:PUA-like domain-containing protein [Obelidium mucronatum]